MGIPATLRLFLLPFPLVSSALSFSLRFQEEEEVLPEGWEKLYDESSGHYYYFNATTEESSWEPPTA